MDFLNLFENIAFPVAVSVLLFWFLYQIVKKEIKQNDTAMQIISEANKKHIEYLENQNEKLSKIIAENTTAFNSLIDILKFIKNRTPN